MVLQPNDPRAVKLPPELREVRGKLLRKNPLTRKFANVCFNTKCNANQGNTCQSETLMHRTWSCSACVGTPPKGSKP